MERALSSGQIGLYTLQAAIAAVHADADTPAATDWAQIVALYDVLAQSHPSPVVELNRRGGGDARWTGRGLELVDAILARGDLADYHLAHSARADLCRRLGRTAEARVSYERALSLTRQEPERRFLEGRLRELQAEPRPGRERRCSSQCPIRRFPLLGELNQLHHAELFVVHHVAVQHRLAGEIEETRAEGEAPGEAR